MHRLALLVLLLAGCEGCAAFTAHAPDVHPILGGPRVIEVRPTPALRLAWATVEYCVGRHEPIDRYRWFLVDGERFYVPLPDGRDSISVVGYHDLARRRIYFARTWAGEPALWRHEILHALGVHYHGGGVYAACGALPTPAEPFEAVE